MMLRRAAPFFVALAALSVIASASACDDGEPAAASTVEATEAVYVWRLPKGMPEPRVPAENPMSTAKVTLGRHLFYDRRLSGNGQQSCASCHEQKRAFTDGLAHAVGSTGQVHRRSSMSLANVGYATTLTWANSLLPGLEAQALLPLFGETPVELGLAGKEDELLARLEATPVYRELFAKAFPTSEPRITLAHVTYGLAAFQRALISGDSPYDRAQHGGPPLSASAARGRALFFGERLECFHCHGGFAFTDAVAHTKTAFPETPFHNTALYDVDGLGGYPKTDTGLHDVTGRPQDMGRFKAPTLRNIAVTAPYMHDGSVATLSEALDHYAAAGRTITEGPDAGVGAKSPLKDPLLRGFTLSAEERVDVLAFLESLTDESFLTDPAFADPWPAP
jgi:cytochrome c peroxidase